jgi:hypothetical protein
MKITYIKIGYWSSTEFLLIVLFVMVYVYSKLSGPKYTDFLYHARNKVLRPETLLQFTFWPTCTFKLCTPVLKHPQSINFP